MHIDLISATKTGKSGAKEIHGTDNGKRTACGINFTKPENIGRYTAIGEMTDVAQLTCEKCKTILAKRIIRESNREMAALLKEEQRQLKRERAAARGHARDTVEVPAVSPSSSAAKGTDASYVPPSMRKAMQQAEDPIMTPPPTPPTPVSMTPPPAPTPAPAQDDVLAQFAIPGMGGTVSTMTPPPAPAPVQDDVLAQFAIPGMGGTVSTMTPPPAPAPAQDDVLAQFAIPGMGGTVSTMTPPPAPAPVQDDVLAQFAIPGMGGTVSRITPPPAPTPAPAQDDVLAQFAIPGTGGTVSTMTPPPAPAPTQDELPTLEIPEVPTSGLGQRPSDEFPSGVSATQPTEQQSLNPFDTVANILFDRNAINQAMPQTDPNIPLEPTIDGLDESKGFVASLPENDDSIIEVNPQPAPDDYDPFLSVSQQKSMQTAVAQPEPMQTLEPITPPSAPEMPTQSPLTAAFAPTGTPESVPEMPMPAPIPSAAMPKPAPMPTAAPNYTQPVQMEIPAVPTSAQPTYAAPTPPPSPVLTNPYGVPQNGIPQAAPYPYPQQPIYGQPPMQPYPTQTMQGNMPYPGYPQQPYMNPYAQPQPQTNLFSVPAAVKPKAPGTPMPLFVGYSADGRQVFQTYDEQGNPIPITEPVYSAPPEDAPKAAPAMPAGGVPVLDMDSLMSAMGIPDPKKQAESEGKAVHYTEYQMPTKKKKKPAPPKPTGTAGSSAAPDTPVSAAEAKRRKKLDKINSDFEKQLRARGINPETGAYIGDKK